MSNSGGGRRVRVTGDLYHGKCPEGAIYVGRPAPGLKGSAFANRHRLGYCRQCRSDHANVAETVNAFAQDLADSPDMVALVRQVLAGVDAACWCKTDGRPCHGDVLVHVAAGGKPEDYVTSPSASRPREPRFRQEPLF